MRSSSDCMTIRFKESSPVLKAPLSSTLGRGKRRWETDRFTATTHPYLSEKVGSRRSSKKRLQLLHPNRFAVSSRTGAATFRLWPFATILHGRLPVRCWR